MDAAARARRTLHRCSSSSSAGGRARRRRRRSAILLALAAHGAGREVVVSRGQLVEIGDGFRIPDVLAQSGARLVEVGSTNRTRRADYARAIGPDTAAVLWVHPSNYRVVGFAESDVARRAAHALRRARAAADRRPRLGVAARPAVLGARADGAGGARRRRRPRDSSRETSCSAALRPVLLAGRDRAIDACRRHPLARALRIDRLSLAALEATLRLYREPRSSSRRSRRCARCSNPSELVRARAERLAARIGGDVVETIARVGGARCPSPSSPRSGSRCPATQRPCWLPCAPASRPVLARIADGACLLDCRTLSDADADEVRAPAR